MANSQADGSWLWSRYRTIESTGLLDCLRILLAPGIGQPGCHRPPTTLPLDLIPPPGKQDARVATDDLPSLSASFKQNSIQFNDPSGGPMPPGRLKPVYGASARMLRSLPEPQALPVAEDPPPTCLYPGSLKLLAVICITANPPLAEPRSDELASGTPRQ